MFSHGAAIRQALAQIQGLPPQRWNEMAHGDNTAVSKLILENGTLSVEFRSDASHLSPEISTLAKQAWWRKDNVKAQDVSLWFRPADWEKERGVYLAARRDAWHSTHGDSPAFDGEGFLQAAEEHLKQSPRAVFLEIDG